MTLGLQAIRSSLRYIASNFEAVIIEGAGSPAEINLNACEIVNMRVAREADVPVVLVADVDRGGSLAAVAGTLELLGSDRDRVKGIIFNNFRGDIKLFTSAIDWTENYTGVKVLGVVPHLEGVYLTGEDSLNIHDMAGTSGINIGVIRLAGIANLSDFDELALEPDVSLSFIDDTITIRDFNSLDAIIIPGTKNTMLAMKELEASGLADSIRSFKGHIFGICGGLQIMGSEILDPDLRENDTITNIKGLGLLPVTTSFKDNPKITRNTSGKIKDTDISVNGYEIHQGTSSYEYDSEFHELVITEGGTDGITNHDMRLSAAYLHGIFSSDDFRGLWLGKIRTQKTHSTNAVRLNAYDAIADLIAQNIDVDFILELIHREGTMPQPE